jgi:anti-anti-sigma factor
VSELVGLDIEHRGSVVLARVTGELDLAGAPRTGESIAEAVTTTARGLVVDFSDLEFIDSSGIAMLFSLARRLGSRRQQLHVVAPPDGAVARVLRIVDFERAAPLYDSRDEAVTAAGARSN